MMDGDENSGVVDDGRLMSGVSDTPRLVLMMSARDAETALVIDFIYE